MMKDSGIEWVGSIPYNWAVVPAGGLFTEIKEKNKNLKYRNPLQFKFGTIVDKAYVGDLDANLLETLSTYTCVEPDTIILNGLNLNYDFVSQRIAIVTKPGVITSAYLAVYPDKSRILPRYANYLLKAYDSIFVFHGMGSGVRKTLQWKDFKNLKFVLPSKEEQSSIIETLDSLVAKTDALIANVQAQIEKLKAYKQSLITEVVTKGLDPTVPMMDSGVEWIGEIPKTWNTIRVKQLLKERKERSVDGSEEPLSMSQKLGLVPTRMMDMVPNMASSFVGAKLAYIDDLVFNKLKAHLGVFSVSKYDGLVSPDYAVYYSTGKVHLKYLEYLFKTPQCISEFRKRATGIAAGLTRLYTDGLFAIECPFPNMDEQVAIVDYLNKKCSYIDQLMTIKQAKIEKLEQYKRSLIYEYVTGKKEVPAQN